MPTVLGGGAFGRYLGHEEGALLMGISVLVEDTPQPSHHVNTQ